MTFRSRRSALLAIVAAALPALASAGADARVDVVLEWNEIMTASVAGQPPPEQNRIAAIAQLAVFEAVNAVTGDYEPYLDAIVPMQGASAEAAVVAAAHSVLTHFFPEESADLDAARNRSLAAIPDTPEKQAGLDVGLAAAASMIAARTNDGSETPEFHLPTSSRAGEWQLTPACPPEGGVFLHFRNVKPFGIRRADQFRSDRPPRLTSRRYATDYEEVRRVGASESTERDPAMARIAEFYAVLSDAPLWNAIARQIARQMAGTSRGSVADSARALALLNMALSDGGVAVLESKYHYDFWRPETAIHDGGRDRNRKTDPDPSFTPFIVAPCFPSYPSGHATTSYAAREVLERVYGDGPHPIVLSRPDEPDVVLHYTRLADIMRDIDDARVYGGIHFRFDQEEAAEQGRRIGAFIHRRHLRASGDPCHSE